MQHHAFLFGMLNRNIVVSYAIGSGDCRNSHLSGFINIKMFA